MGVLLQFIYQVVPEEFYFSGPSLEITALELRNSRISPRTHKMNVFEVYNAMNPNLSIIVNELPLAYIVVVVKAGNGILTNCHAN